MSDLLLKFLIILEDRAESDDQINFGPKFHRWLPNGKDDCVKLDTGHPDLDLEVWHERCGFLDTGFRKGEILFDYRRSEVDTDVMAKQGVLQAGPLFGRLTYRNPPSSSIEVIRGNKIGDPEYISFAKSVVIKIIYPSINKLLNIYRYNFGQYWVPSLKPWDSREDTLGAYCKHLNIKYSLDGGTTWRDFLPDNPMSNLYMTIQMDRHYREYITEVDWKNIPNFLHDRPLTTTAELFFNRSCTYKNKGEYRTALIDAVTSLELAIQEFLQRNTHVTKNIAEQMNAFWTLPLQTRMSALSVVMKKNTAEEIEHAAEAIEVRNKCIHKGINPPDNSNEKLTCLLKVITSFLPGPFYRFPDGYSGNAWAEPEKWNEIYQKCGYDPID